MTENIGEKLVNLEDLKTAYDSLDISKGKMLESLYGECIQDPTIPPYYSIATISYEDWSAIFSTRNPHVAINITDLLNAGMNNGNSNLYEAALNLETIYNKFLQNGFTGQKAFALVNVTGGPAPFTAVVRPLTTTAPYKFIILTLI